MAYYMSHDNVNHSNFQPCLHSAALDAVESLRFPFARWWGDSGGGGGGVVWVGGRRLEYPLGEFMKTYHSSLSSHISPKHTCPSFLKSAKKKEKEKAKAKEKEKKKNKKKDSIPKNWENLS